MDDRLLEQLDRQGMLLTDSAMGTMLELSGLVSGSECGELWNIDPAGREKVMAIHRANIEAGSDIVIANTFGANPFKLAHYGADGKTEEINRAAAEIAVEASADKAVVAGDMGPSGEILEEWGGGASRDKLREGYARQARGLVDGGVRMIALETFMDVEELICALEAVREAADDIPVLGSMTFAGSPGGIRTMWGLSPTEAAQRMESAGVQMVGANCGMGSEDMLKVTAEMALATELPVAAQPNAGAPEVRDGVTVFPETARETAAYAVRFKEAGVRILGGCCGSTPDYIAAARSNLEL
ncbi:MAG: methionine synthase [Candidatus Glassbacteria bacterium]|nr:methionine synthase [Candidatus Glassbacteria bacterium]